jgi:hypothetical protein
MKKFYPLLFITCISLTASSQTKLGGSYSMSVPRGEMGDNIGLLHSLNFTFQYSIPGTSDRLVVGAETGLGIYASIMKHQDLSFPDGSGIQTDVNYTSNVFNGSLFTRVNFLKDRTWSPYVNLKGGYSQFYSNVVVGDPEDASSCEALERKNLIRDHTFFMAYGGGVQIDLSVFSRKEKPGKCLIDLSVNKINGGSLNYINTKHIESEMHTDPNNPAPTTGKGEPFNLRFINITTQTIHEHQVAELYNSPLRMLDIKVGMLFTL